MEKLIAYLDNFEIKEITDCYEKITAYRNLLKIIQNQMLKEKVEKDLYKESQLYDQWWDKMVIKYRWGDKNNLILKFVDGSVWQREV